MSGRSRLFAINSCEGYSSFVLKFNIHVTLFNMPQHVCNSPLDSFGCCKCSNLVGIIA